jgi:hypothetical protein
MNAQSKSRRSWLLWTMIPAALAVFAAANIHLVYVAVTSQPDCVPHLKEAGGGETYRAAKSAC